MCPSFGLFTGCGDLFDGWVIERVCPQFYVHILVWCVGVLKCF